MGQKISAILLAAGLSRRMGEDKLLIEYRGTTLLQRAVDLLAELPVSEKILVTTAERLETILLPQGVRAGIDAILGEGLSGSIRLGLETVLLPREVRAQINANPGEGVSGSIRLGLEAARGEWYFFMTADQPGLTMEDVLPLFGYAGHSQGKIVYPLVNGEPCTPALFSSCFRAELLALSGDTGGRVVREAHPEACVEVAPNNPAHFSDIDYREDLTSVEESNP